jgi:glutamyl-tRNA synthetase/nondiscriminating glutamyl-tRNA synthetase
VFDQEKLYWLNRHYMKECPPQRLVELAIPFLRSAGYLDAQPTPEVAAWLEGVLNAVLKNLSTFEQLPDAVGIIFEYDARKAVEELDLAATPSARSVLGAFIPKALAHPELSYEQFRALTKEVQKETGNKGKDLFHPIRVALTAADSGPELEKLIPIFEAGAKLPLPRHVKSVAERLREFALTAGI